MTLRPHRVGRGSRRGMAFLAAAVASAAACGVLAGPARAAGFDLDFFKPATPSTGYFNEANGLTLGRGSLEMGMAGGYSHRPLVLHDQTGATGGDVVRDRITGFVMAAFGITDRIDVGVRVAAVLQQLGTVDADLSSTGGVPQRPEVSALGDTDVILRVALLDVDHRYRGFRLTLTAPVGLPTGRGEALSSRGAPSFRPQLTARWELTRFSGSASVGYAFRSAVEVPSSNLVVGNAALAGAGISYALIPDSLWAQAEISALAGAVVSSTGAAALATQAIAGARALLPGQIVVQAGLGTGLTRTAGSPQFTVAATVGRAWSIR